MWNTSVLMADGEHKHSRLIPRVAFLPILCLRYFKVQISVCIGQAMIQVLWETKYVLTMNKTEENY